MSKPKQTTLFQSWGGTSSSQSGTSNPKKPASSRGKVASNGSKMKNSASVHNSKLLPQSNFVDLSYDSDENDAELLAAMEESLRYANGDYQSSSSVIENGFCSSVVGNSSEADHAFGQAAAVSDVQKNLPTNAFTAILSNKRTATAVTSSHSSTSSVHSMFVAKDRATTSDRVYPSDSLNATSVEDLPGFDTEAGRLWIYPTNYPVRNYQFRIVEQALKQNTLVTLPTGLGKTFVAAVVMFNFYRWYPTSKIVFMAPTKPLVAQQIEACHGIAGIPMDDTAEMTGAMQPNERSRAWREKRVFFLTPQVMVNDLSRGICPAGSVKCLVVDEAHKALGNHAYCQVVRELVKTSTEFRVVALSATPGSDIKAVQQVLNNLLISHIELRTEESADVQPYTHERRVEKIVVPLGDELTSARDSYFQIMDGVVMRLKRAGVLYGFNRETKSLSKFLILKARDSFRQNPPPNLQRTQYGSIEGDFALAMSLYHGYELLQLHGLRSLYTFLESLVAGEKGCGRTRSELLRNENFGRFMDMLRSKHQLVKCADPNVVLPSQRGASQVTSLAVGHPKMAKLEEIVLEHFIRFREESDDSSCGTRIMIFSQYRDSVNEITEILNQHRPLVKVMSFVGHSTTGKNSKGFTQKDQLRVMRQFREGGYNTLVSTCIGEEGLDIGDVDLIICFDAHKSPIRLVQRMGRTGRKREGRIVMLVTEGKEEQIYNQSEYNKRSIHRAISNGTKSLHFYQPSPRMVPRGVSPECHRMPLVVPRFCPQTKSKLTSAASSASLDNLQGMTGAKVKKALVKDSFLNETELKYWSENFKVDDENDVPAFPEQQFLFGQHDSVTGARKRDRKKTTLSLDKWLPWQSRLQETHAIGHSVLSESLVDLLEFINVQGMSSGDNYGMEMKLFLNEDDVLLDNRQRDTSSTSNYDIRNCFQPVSANDGHCKLKNVSRVAASNTEGQRSRQSANRQLVTTVLDLIDVGDGIDSDFELAPCPASPKYDESRFTDDQAIADGSVVNTSDVRRRSLGRNDIETVFGRKLRSDSDFVISSSSSSGRSCGVKTPPCLNVVSECLARFDETGIVSPVDLTELSELIQSESETKTGRIGFKNSSVGWKTASGNATKTAANSIGKVSQDVDTDELAVARCPVQLSDLETKTWSERNKLKSDYSIDSDSKKKSPRAAMVDVESVEDVTFDRRTSTDGSCKKVNNQQQFKSLRSLAATESSAVECEANMSSAADQTFDDDDMDAFFVDFATPAATGAAAASCAVKMDTSQVTFTQALAYLNESFNTSSTLDPACRQNAVLNESACRIARRSNVPSENRETKIGDGVELVAQVCSVIDDAPQFDLGFDLSDASSMCGSGDELPQDVGNERNSTDDSDDGIIPPSPEAISSTLQRSRLIRTRSLESSTTSTCSNSHQLPTMSLRVPETQFIQKPEVLSDNNSSFTDCMQQSFEETGNRTASKIDNVCSSLSSGGFHSATPKTVISDTRQVVSPPDVAVSEQRWQSGLRTSFTEAIEAVCSQPVAVIQPSIRPSTAAVTPQFDNATASTPYRRQQDIGNISNDFKTPLTVSSEKIGRKRTKVKMILSSDDESPIVRKKPDKCLPSLEESPVVRSNKLKVSSSRVAAADLSEEDDFDECRKVVSRVCDKKSFKVSKVQRKTKPVRKEAARKFLDEEAEVSDDDDVMSADECDNDSDLDCMESSFINDETQLTQAEPTTSKGAKDIRAIYMQSVRSPFNGRRNIIRDIERYRQQRASRTGRRQRYEDTQYDEYSDDDDDDDYEEDSFCVNENITESEDDDVEYVTDEVSPCDISSQRLKTGRRVTRRNSRKEATGEKLETNQRRRRIVQDTDSSDEDRPVVMTTARKLLPTLHQSTNNISTSSTLNPTTIRRQETTPPAKQQENVNSIKKFDREKFDPMNRTSTSAIKATSSLTAAVVADAPTFSLDDFLMDDDADEIFAADENCRPLNDGKKLATEQASSKSNFGAKNSYQSDAAHSATTAPSLNCTSAALSDRSNVDAGNSRPVTMDAEQIRQERLRLSRLKREEFQKKLASNRQKDEPQENHILPVRFELESNPSVSRQPECVRQQNCQSSVRDSNENERHIVQLTKKLCILVDSRELSGAQEIVSALRFQHGSEVVVRQLVHCDYIVSSRMAVERKSVSDFTNSSNKVKIFDRLRQMCTVFDRPCLIIEKDAVKGWSKDGNAIKSILKSHYAEHMLACLTKRHIKVLYSESYAETASILAELCQQESVKNQALVQCNPLSSEQEQVLKFYMSLPDVSCATALNLLHGFKTIASFVCSSIEKLSVTGRMSMTRAQQLHDYLRHKFNAQMTGRLS